MFRVGNGVDVHRFAKGRPLILCGVKIPSESGLDGHSDADVAAHALMDAILGALALGDIGQWFPDNDPAFKDADSLKLLSSIISDAKFKDWSVVNIDITIIAQKPKISPHYLEMRKNLAKIMDCEIDQISVKATTTEKLGFCGREEGIAAYATVLLAGRKETMP